MYPLDPIYSILADQQELILYDHTETRTKFIQEFLFRNDDELDIPRHQR
jgi:hypothetical protein